MTTSDASIGSSRASSGEHASATTKNADAVKALIAFLASPKVTPILKAKGLERF